MTRCEILVKDPLRGMFQVQGRHTVDRPGPNEQARTIIPTPGTRNCIFLDHGTSDVSPVDIYLLINGDNSPSTRLLLRSLGPGEETTWTDSNLFSYRCRHRGETPNNRKDALDANRAKAKALGFEGFK